MTHLIRRVVCFFRYLLPCRVFGHIKPDPMLRSWLFGNLCMRCTKEIPLPPQPETEEIER